MSSVVLTPYAQRDLQRLAIFLHDNGAIAQAKTLANLLLDKIDLLAISPQLGKIYNFLPNEFVMNVDDEIRELIINYGKSGYKILYVYQMLVDTIVVISIKHCKEKSYPLFN